MIEIITTRFHEAYTWILPPEQHGRHGQNFMKEQHIASIKRFNEVPRRRFPLMEEEKGTHVINFCLALFFFYVAACRMI
jgi:hypothetical protein